MRNSVGLWLHHRTARTSTRPETFELAPPDWHLSAPSRHGHHRQPHALYGQLLSSLLSINPPLSLPPARLILPTRFPGFKLSCPLDCFNPSWISEQRYKRRQKTLCPPHFKEISDDIVLKASLEHSGSHQPIFQPTLSPSIKQIEGWQPFLIAGRLNTLGNSGFVEDSYIAFLHFDR